MKIVFLELNLIEIFNHKSEQLIRQFLGPHSFFRM